MLQRIAAVLCYLAIAGAAIASERGVVEVTSPHPRFVMVLTVGPEEKPDLARYGATEEHRWHNRVFIRISEEKARELSAHPGVHYVQRMLATGESSDFVSAPRPGGDAIAANAVTSPVWNSGTYTYDGLGNVINIGTDYYVYDGLNRLTRASLTGTGAYDTYTYDSFGNLVHRGTTLGGGTSSQTIPVNGWDNKLSGAVYDEAGNLETDANLPYGFEYDPFNMVFHRYNFGGQQHYYVYDAKDERIGALNNGAGVWNWSVRDLDGQVARVYESPFWAGADWLWLEDFVRRGRVAVGSERMAGDGGRRHFHHDHLGTIRMVTNHGGQALSRHDYSPFGLELTSIRQELDRGYDRVNTMTFTGHERDYNGGTQAQNTDYTDYMHARYYRPTLGRFLTSDPALDVKRSMAAPQMWNRYAYVMNNPVRNTDPTGRIVVVTGKGEEEKDRMLEWLKTALFNQKAAQFLQMDESGKLTIVGMSVQAWGEKFGGNAAKLASLMASTTYTVGVGFSNDATTIKKGGGGWVSTGRGQSQVTIADSMLPRMMGGVKQHTDTVLAHELFGHAMMDAGLIRQDVGSINKWAGFPWITINESDPAGMWAENQYRTLIGDPLRKYYAVPGDYTPPTKP